MTRPTQIPAPANGWLQLLLVAALLVLLAPGPVSSKGSLTVPRSRNVITPQPVPSHLPWMTAPSKDDGNGLANYWFLYPGIKLFNGPGVQRPSNSYSTSLLPVVSWQQQPQRHFSHCCLLSAACADTQRFTRSPGELN